MSLQRRTLCFVLLLFLDNDFRFVSGVSVETITTEYISQPQGPPPPKVYSYGPYPPPTVARPNYYENYPVYSTTVEISNPEPEKVESPPQPPNQPRYPNFPPRPSNPQTHVQETLQTRYFPDRYPHTETKTTNYTIPSNEMNSNKSVIVQINVPAPEPVATILPQPPCRPTFDYSPCGMPPSPVIVKEKSKSSLKSILPILFLSLFDGGRGNNGCCCQKPTNIPVPYPIPVPYNNPVVTHHGKEKRKKPAKDHDHEDNDDK